MRKSAICRRDGDADRALLCLGTTGVPGSPCRSHGAAYPLLRVPVVKERRLALMLAFDAVEEILRALFAAVLQPELDDLRNARLEKLHVIPDELILKMGPGAVLVIGDDRVLVIIAEPEIGLYRRFGSP